MSDDEAQARLDNYLSHMLEAAQLLASASPKPDIRAMPTSVKKRSSQATRHGSSTSHAFVYRGVTIAPMTGPRSSTARTIRDALQAEYGRHSSGKTTRD